MKIYPRMFIIYYTLFDIIFLSFFLSLANVCKFFATMKIVGKDVYSCTNLTSGGEVFM